MKKRSHFVDNIVGLDNLLRYWMGGNSRIRDNSQIFGFNTGEDSGFIF